MTQLYTHDQGSGETSPRRVRNRRPLFYDRGSQGGAGPRAGEDYLMPNVTPRKRPCRVICVETMP